MTTLLLRLSGPMQSWGVQSKFTIRETGREPSKSGVIGLLCAALGRPRDAALGDLAALRMGVRVDQEGTLERDYHTAGKGGFYRVSGKVEQKALIPSSRYYLAGAVFLVGLEGEPAVLRQCFDALRNPVWSLYLGRKAFVPGEPVWLSDGFRQNESLAEAIQNYPWIGRNESPPERIRVVIEDIQGTIIHNDQPVSFAERRFVPRRVRIDFINPPHSPEEVL